MTVSDVYVLKEAADDLDEGKSFYDLQEQGLGDYFWDCLIKDIESLMDYAGIHQQNLDLFQMLAKRFPYAIYYYIADDIAYVAAILPMRRDPAWISEQLRKRL